MSRRATPVASGRGGLVTVEDFVSYAHEVLPKNTLDYYASGADAQQTLAENEAAFQRLRIRPRVLVDVSSVDTTTELLGVRVSSPLCIAPTAFHRLAHPDGELATSRASGKHGSCMILSSISTTPLEDVAQAAPDSLHWFQLYVYKDRKVTQSLVRRAEAAGYRAIVLTVDTPVLGNRVEDKRCKFQLPPHLRVANFMGSEDKAELTEDDSDSGLAAYAATMFDQSLSWKDVAWLVKFTKLPVICKGIMCAEDATKALGYGVKGILVSNHGARQLDGVTSTIEALPEIVAAVQGQVDVYLDGGIRRGTDIFKALALGAKAVFIGRPVLYGLTYDGQAGVERVLEILQDEFVRAMRLAGCPAISDITANHIAWEGAYRQARL